MMVRHGFFCLNSSGVPNCNAMWDRMSKTLWEIFVSDIMGSFYKVYYNTVGPSVKSGIKMHYEKLCPPILWGLHVHEKFGSVMGSY